MRRFRRKNAPALIRATRRAETLVGANGPVGECQPAALAPTDHGLDDVAEKPACRSAVSQFAAPLKVLPGDLERILEELGERDGHEQNTNESRARSMSSPLRRLLAEIEYRAKSADGKVRHPFFKGDAALLLADIPLRDTKLFRTMCVKSGAWTA